MNNKIALFKKVSGLTGIAVALFTAAGFYLTTTALSASSTTDIDYFKGIWTVTLRNNPELSFKWTVREDLGGTWLNGVVEKDGTRISTDFWRENGKKIERFAFTGNSRFIKIEGSGWDAAGHKMVLTGIMNDQESETRIRETITKVNDQKFNALWESQDADGKWTVFGDEICTKGNN